MRKLWQSEQEKAVRSQAQPDSITKPLENAAGPKAAGPAKRIESSNPATAPVTSDSQVTTPAHRSFVGSAMSITGELEANEDLLVAGRIEGSVSLPEHCLTVASTGTVHASISAKSVIVEGEVQGDLDCSDSVVLKATARVTGDIRMRRINITDGAVFNGKVTMRLPED